MYLLIDWLIEWTYSVMLSRLCGRMHMKREVDDAKDDFAKKKKKKEKKRIDYCQLHEVSPSQSKFHNKNQQE